MDQDETWHAGRPQPWPHCVSWVPNSPSSKGAQPSNFRPMFIVAKRLHESNGTWSGGGLFPDHIVLDGDPVPPSPKRGGQPPPTFGPFLLWPNGSMHQDATWYAGRPRSRPHCARWGRGTRLTSPKRDTAHQFSAHFYCGQTATRIKMPLCMEVGLGPGDCVRWDPGSPTEKRHSPHPILAHVYCGQMAGWMKMPCHLVRK